MYRSRLAFALAMTALAAILLPSPLPAQVTFQRTYGGADGDWGSSARQTTDGGYIATGKTSSFGAGRDDVFLVKTDADGNTMWTRTFGGEDDEWGSSVQQTSDGGYVVAGYTESFGAGQQDVYLVKTDSFGDTVWTRTFGGTGYDRGWSVQQTTDGGYIITGEVHSFGAGGYDVYLIRTDLHGDTLWTRTYGGAGDDFGYSVQQTSDIGFVIAGMTRSFGSGGTDFYLVRTNANGDTLWTRTYGGAGDEEGWSVAQTADSNYVIAGATTSYGAGSWDAYLVRTDGSGYTLWTKTFGGADMDWGSCVRQTARGGYIMAGYTRSHGAGSNDVYLINTDANGDTLWTRAFGGAAYDRGYSAQQTADGGYIVAGTTASFGAGDYDVYLIKTDSLGYVAVAEPKTSPTRAPALSLTCEPNPFAGTTTIHLAPFASRHSPLALRIYDAQGRAIRSFSSLLSPPSSLTWDGRDDLGQPLPSGAYFIRCDVTGERASTRLILQH